MYCSKLDFTPTEEQQAKIDEAVKLGLIIEHEGCYELTQKGFNQWMSEELQNRRY